MPADPAAPPAAPCAATTARSIARLLADVEADAHASGWGRPASLLRVDDLGGRLVVAARSLPPDTHPAATLLGRTAPVSSIAVGVVAEGRAHRIAGGGDPESSGARRTEGTGSPDGAAHLDGAPGAPAPDGATTDGPDQPGASTRVRVAVLVGRDGRIASVVRLDGGPPSLAVHHSGPRGGRALGIRWGAVPGPGSPAGVVHEAGHDPLAAGSPPPAAPDTPAGRLVDLLLRGLALPTAPPPTSTTRLWAVVWLQAVAAVAHAAPGLPWPVVAALHPARRLLSGGVPPAPGAVPEAATPGAGVPPAPGAVPEASTPGAAGEPSSLGGARRTVPTRDAGAAVSTGDPVRSLVAAGTAAGGLVTWAGLHADAAAGRWPAPGLEPADASWLDTGAFARWVLGELPPVGALARAATDHLHPCVATTVERVLAAWGLGADRGR